MIEAHTITPHSYSSLAHSRVYPRGSLKSSGGRKKIKERKTKKKSFILRNQHSEQGTTHGSTDALCKR